MRKMCRSASYNTVHEIRQTKPKCANCEEMHPANYRGCKVAKRLQEIRNAKSRPNKGSSQSKKPMKEERRTIKTNVISTSREDKRELTYAQIANNNIGSNSDRQNSTISNKTEQILQRLLKSIELINKRLDRELGKKGNGGAGSNKVK